MTRATSTIRVVSPTRARTLSPGDTMVDGLASRSLTCTRPPRHAAAASGRVFVSRTAHNHRSTRVDSITSIMGLPIGMGKHEDRHISKHVDLQAYYRRAGVFVPCQVG